MRKRTFLTKFCTALAACFALAPLTLCAQQTASTLGTDFWMTFMRSDADNPSELSINISASEATHVKIENPSTGYVVERDIVAGGLETVYLLGNGEDHKDDCYVGTEQEEIVTKRALHITSDKDISVFAANWREKSFDVANVLPTYILRDEYVVACYRPEDHENKYQGSHFAIIATEDNTVVDFVPTAKPQYFVSNVVHETPTYTVTEWNPGDTLTTPVMNAGDVFYVWSGKTHGLEADLTGTYVRARNEKPIAVFNGNPHTNIGLDKDGNGARDRDHIYSQAYPTVYWGTKFPIVASQTTSEDSLSGQKIINRKKDKIRVLALYDGTEVRVNGELMHIFNFEENPRHFYEFELGQKNITDKDDNIIQDPGIDVVEGISCIVETSCPTATHLYMVSNRYDYPKGKYCNGDPAMIWMNPVEQQIDQITFATYKSMDHFLNIVTTDANTATVQLDEEDITDGGTYLWQDLAGNAGYKFMRRKIEDGTHTLKADGGFTAHVYGFKEKESYGYSAGGSAIALERSVTINGVVVREGEVQQICQDGAIPFVADLNYETEIIRWDFGDGTPAVETENGETIDHTYEGGGSHRAHLYIKFASNDECGGRSAMKEANLYFDVTNGVPEMLAQRGGDYLVLRSSKEATETDPARDLKTEFEGATYQWFKDGQEIPGATLPYLHETLEADKAYYVRVDKKDGTQVYTCPISPVGGLSELNTLATIRQTIVYGDGSSDIDISVAVDEQLLGSAMARVISSAGMNMNTQPVVAGQNTVTIPGGAGLYVLDIRADDGRKATFKIIVK